MMKNFIAGLLILALFSCVNDDDVCTSGEATPRMKVKFKNQLTGNEISLDSLAIAVDYGQGLVTVVSATKKIDSALIPLRVDQTTSTKLYIATSQQSTASQLEVKYSTENRYVSPACGVKKLYKNVSYDIINASDLKSVQANQNEILDEQKTHLYLYF